MQKRKISDLLKEKLKCITPLGVEFTKKIVTKMQHNECVHERRQQLHFAPKGSKIIPEVNLTSGQIIIMQLIILCSLKGCFYFA